MKGSCHCGAVSYEATRVEGPLGHCHCITCRKTHSARFNTTAWVPREFFRWVTGEDKLSAYQSAPNKKRYFCSGCGCHIVAVVDGRPGYIVRVASLDEDPGLRPKHHIWTSHDVPWLVDEGDVPRYAEWQPGR
jgi:hypothetical protein